MTRQTCVLVLLIPKKLAYRSWRLEVHIHCIDVLAAWANKQCAALALAVHSRLFGQELERQGFGAKKASVALLSYTTFSVSKLLWEHIPSTAAMLDEKKEGRAFRFPLLCIAFLDFTSLRSPQ